MLPTSWGQHGLHPGSVDLSCWAVARSVNSCPRLFLCAIWGLVTTVAAAPGLMIGLPALPGFLLNVYYGYYGSHDNVAARGLLEPLNPNQHPLNTKFLEFPFNS